MRRKRLATWWWPGLSEIWVSGRPWGLWVALAAAGLLNLALLGSFAWTEPCSPPWRIGLWSAVAVVWGGWALFANVVGSRSAADGDRPPSAQDTLGEAQEHYLKGHYLQAELVLVDLLRRNRRDVEARLMLATLLRRTDRIDEAVARLDELARNENAEAWSWEIERERELIRALRKSSSDEQPHASDVSQEQIVETGDVEPLVERQLEQLLERTETDDHRGSIRPAA